MVVTTQIVGLSRRCGSVKLHGAVRTFNLVSAVVVQGDLSSGSIDGSMQFRTAACCLKQWHELGPARRKIGCQSTNVVILASR